MREMDSDVKALIAEEVFNMTLHYSILLRLTGFETKVILGEEPKKFELLEDGYRRISVSPLRKRKIYFSFTFRETNKEIAMKLVWALEGLMFYSFKRRGNEYYSEYDMSFTLEFDTEQESEEFFKKLFVQTN